MADELMKQWGSWVILIVCFGSLVDLLQFLWLTKRSFRKLKRSMYNRIKREILEERGLSRGHREDC